MLSSTDSTSPPRRPLASARSARSRKRLNRVSIVSGMSVLGPISRTRVGGKSTRVPFAQNRYQETTEVTQWRVECELLRERQCACHPRQLVDKRRWREHTYASQAFELDTRGQQTWQHVRGIPTC